MKTFPPKDISFLIPEWKEGYNIYFASDFHLGAPNQEISLEREKAIVRWLKSIKEKALVLFLMGDVFDFWFEYKYVQPKGFWRILGALSELADHGVKIVFFGGNHDMWTRGAYKEQLSADFFLDPCTFTMLGKSFYIHHGDGLPNADNKYKLIRNCFVNPFLRKLGNQLHPDLIGRLAYAWSKSSRHTNHQNDKFFLAKNEWLWQFAEEIESKQHFDFYVFGHRHLPMDLPVGIKNARYLNSGEWFNFNSYLVFDGKTTRLNYFEKTHNPHLDFKL